MKLKEDKDFDSLYREFNIDKAIFVKDVKVKLPFDEEGVIINTCHDGGFDFFPYKVRITHSPFGVNVIGDVIEFKNTQLNLL